MSVSFEIKIQFMCIQTTAYALPANLSGQSLFHIHVNILKTLLICTVSCFFSQSELQIRGGIEDKSKIIFSYFSMKMFCDPSLELSGRDGFNDGSQNMF